MWCQELFQDIYLSVIAKLFFGNCRRSAKGTPQYFIGHIQDITERKQAEEALHQSEENFRRSLDDSPLGVRIVTEEGETIYVNRAILDIYGYDNIEELKTTPVVKRYTPESFAEYQIRREKRKRGDYAPSEYETRIIRKDGEVRHIHVFRKEILWDGERQFQVLYNDITARKRTEEALEKSVQLLRDTGEMAEVGGWELDLSTEEVSWTEEVGRIHGVEPGYKPKLEEAIKFYAPESIPALKETLKKTIETGEPYDLESLFTPSGSKDKIWVRSLGRAVYSDGKIVKLAGTFQNIDKYKRAEEGMRETNAYLDNLFNYANAPIIVWDQEFMVARFNHAFERLTGYMAEEVIGKNLQILFPVSSREESLVLIESTLSGEYWESVEIPILCKDGGIRTALWNSANIYTTDRATLIATIAQGQDITERKQQTTELIRSNREKALLLKEIHHRVKNNLQIIASLLRLNTKYSGDERVEEIFRESQDRIRAMAAVHSMLYKSENFAEINFGEYVRETARQLFRSYNTNLEAISLLINAEDVILPVDTAIPCGLIINELISNTLKHALPDGRRGEIRLEMKKDENDVRIIFEDNGVGFPEDMDFRNTETLGLQLVNMLVAQLDGAIEMVRNGGTRYVITLKT
ncbi:MAG: PAS domain S-box protein [Deltaproteobacteria bacterium]|nr:PAS domain S-box protein [Deltaproteobacteria bacterium]